MPGRPIAVVLVVLAAGCIVFAANSNRWLHHQGADGGIWATAHEGSQMTIDIGLRRVSECRPEVWWSLPRPSGTPAPPACIEDSLTRLTDRSLVFIVFGGATLATSLAAALLLIVAGWQMLRRARSAIVQRCALGLLALALMAAIGFVGFRPTSYGELSLSVAAIVFGLGIAAGLAALVTMTPRYIRYRDHTAAKKPSVP